MLEIQFEMLRKLRKSVINITADLSEAQFNYIPRNNNNNIIWNFAHMLSIQQLLCYGMCKVPYTISEDIIMPFRKNTKPDGTYDMEFVQTIRDLALPQVDVLEERYFKGELMHVPVPFRSGLGIEFDTIEGIIQFNTYHEAHHMTVIMQYLKEINSIRSINSM